MDVLHLTTEPPYFPAGSGGSTRQFYLLRRLVEHGFRVRVVATTTPSRREQSDVDRICRTAGIELHVVQRDESRFREALRAARRDPITVPSILTRPWLAWRGSVFLPDVRDALGHLLRDWQPHVVTVEHDHLAHWAAVPELAEFPKVLSTQNASWTYYASRSLSADSHVDRWRSSAEARRYAHFVRRWFPWYERIVATSALDKQRIRQFSSGPIDIVPNGADFGTFVPTPPLTDPPTALFTGTLFHPPNVAGVAWFVHHVWPDVLTNVPRARFRIVGRDPAPEVKALTGQPGVELVGSVPDMRPYFAQSTVAVVPLLAGGGTRLKIAEALGSGRAVVSTSIGAEGLDLVPGRDLLIADSPEDFAAAVVRIFENRELRDRLALDGRATAADRYDWCKLGDSFAAVLERARPAARHP